MGIDAPREQAPGVSAGPAGAHRRQHGPRGTRAAVVVLVLLLVLLVGGPQLALWSGAPLAAKDCVVSPAPPLPAEIGARTTRPGATAYPGGLEQQGGAVTDASCLTRTPVFGVVRPRDEADVRTALAFAEEHDLVVAVGGTQHALGGQASYPGGLVVDMRGLDSVTVDEGGGRRRCRPVPRGTRCWRRCTR